MIDDLIYDLGFHNGDDTDFYLAKGFRVVAVEANPALAQNGRERFSNQISNGLLIILNQAVHDNKDMQKFYIHPNKSDWSSCLQEMAESDGSRAKVITVETVRLVDLYESYGVPRYMKVDIEGCDVIVARHISQFQEKPKFVSFEISKKDFSEIFAYLHISGYTGYQLINQANNPSRSTPIVTGEGKEIQYTFSPYSSGYFGEDLPHDKWLSYEEALMRYIKYKELKQIDNQELGLGWVDLHARSD